MEDILGQVGRLGGAVSVFGIVAAGWWNIDRLLSNSAGEALGRALTKVRADTDWEALLGSSTDLLRELVSPQLPITRFLRTVAISVLVGLSVFLVLYFMAVPRFALQMWEDSFARWRALRHLAGYGLPVVFVCTYVSFFMQGYFLDSLARSSLPRLLAYLVFDIVLRLIAFAAVSAVIFVVFARFLGSFSGSIRSALRAVLPTMQGSVAFGDLSGVYLYAAILSAFPLFILMALKAMAGHAALRVLWGRSSRVLPIAEKPLRFCVLLVAAVVAVCGSCSVLFLRSLGHYVG